MINRYTCRAGKDLWFDNAISALSPTLDLASYVAAEKKRENNIYDREDEKRLRDLNILLPVWSTVGREYYLVSGSWMRRWVQYIFVEERGEL